MTIEIWLGIALISSLLLNGVLLWLSIIQSRRLSYVSENASDLIDIVANYKNHLKKIYDMEMFYGDETLEYLMEHTRSLVSILEEEYGDIIFISEPLEIDYNKEEESASDEQEETSQEKDVFYAGSRKRDS